MPRFSATITGINPTNATDTNENELNVSRMCEMSGSRHAMRTPERSHARPCSTTLALARRGYTAHRRPITANK